MDQKGFLAAEHSRDRSPGRLVRPKLTQKVSEEIKAAESMNVEVESEKREDLEEMGAEEEEEQEETDEGTWGRKQWGWLES